MWSEVTQRKGCDDITMQVIHNYHIKTACTNDISSEHTHIFSTTKVSNQKALKSIQETAQTRLKLSRRGQWFSK